MEALLSSLFSISSFPMPRMWLTGVPADLLDYEVTMMAMEQLYRSWIPTDHFFYVRTEIKTNKKWPFILSGCCSVGFPVVQAETNSK